jgi:superoxide reductase
MAVEQVGETYRCNVCGNEVKVIKVGGGTPVCCGQDMEKMEEHGQSPVNLPETDG